MDGSCANRSYPSLPNSPLRASLMCLVALFLVACGQESLYSRLDEREANEMVAVLGKAGIPASKSGDLDGGFSVATTSRLFADAVSVLQRNGLPRERYETIGDVFAKEGFVSSPLEERARLNFALSQEIAHTISSIDGVVIARVHLAVPAQDDFSDEIQPASASVFVKHRDSVDLSGSVAQIKALVVNGIENLPYENVTVALFATDSEPSAGGAANTGSERQSIETAGFSPASLQLSNVSAPLVILALVILAAACAWFGWLRDKSGSSAPAEAADATSSRRDASWRS